MLDNTLAEVERAAALTLPTRPARRPRYISGGGIMPAVADLHAAAARSLGLTWLARLSLTHWHGMRYGSDRRDHWLAVVIHDDRGRRDHVMLFASAAPSLHLRPVELGQDLAASTARLWLAYRQVEDVTMSPSMYAQVEAEAERLRQGQGQAAG